jgi:hypothetical protein
LRILVSNWFAAKKAAIDADERGSSQIKPKRVSVNPLYPRHQRSINPYTDLQTALFKN